MNNVKSKKVYIGYFVVSAMLLIAVYNVFGINKTKELTIKDDEAITVVVSGSIAEKDLNELKKNSTLVVYGEVVDVSEPFKVKPVGGGDASIFTDYYIDAKNILRGDKKSLSDTSKIPVRIQGGEIDGMTVVAEEETTLVVGETYLLFLIDPNRGGGYNTDGEYFYINGLKQGVYKEKTNGNLENEKSNEKINLGSIISEMAKINKEVPLSTKEEDQFYENLEKNLASGFIDEEEYNTLIENSEIYAEIIE